MSGRAARMPTGDRVPTRGGRQRSLSYYIRILSARTATTADRPRRAATSKGLCVRGGGPAANFFVVT